MQKYIRRTLCIYATAVAVVPLTVSGTEVHVPPSAPPHPPPPQDPHWQAAGAAGYAHHQPAAYPSGAIPAAHPHAPHGYVGHDPAVPPPPTNTAAKDASGDHHPSPKHYPLWEQSSGAVELTNHSWQPPLAQEHLSHWDVAMSTVPSGDHVLLLPGDANRTGQFWHRNAMPSAHFEVQFGFGVFGKDQGINEAAGGVTNGVGIPDGFAFWYVYEPYAQVYPRSAEEQASWNLIGYKSNPKGLGVVFKVMDRAGHINPSVSCIHNTEDGRSLAEEIPSSSALFYQYRNQSSPRHAAAIRFCSISSKPGVLTPYHMDTRASRFPLTLLITLMINMCTPMPMLSMHMQSTTTPTQQRLMLIPTSTRITHMRT
ncbi:hypothetical protein Emag_003771 [Eimeria magna]